MGRDKARIEMNGETLLDQQIQKAEVFFHEVVLLSGQNIYSMTNRRLPDTIEHAGPLAGLLEALTDGADHTMSHIAIIPVDLPFLTETTLKRFSKIEPGKTDEAVILKSGDDLQPLAGLYNTDLVDKLNSYLDTGNRMVFGFLNQLRYSAIEVNKSELQNFNRPEDL